MFQIQEIDPARFSLSEDVVDLMPRWEEIPEEFRPGNSSLPWVRVTEDWFYQGLSSFLATPKEGVDTMLALRHLGTIMRSFQPKHEHKIAAVAYLMSQWFDDVAWEANKRKVG